MKPEKYDASGLIVGSAYDRAEVARAGKVSPPPPHPSQDEWYTGIVEFQNLALFFVTLEKEDSDYSYVDHFEGTSFWWQSQNRQSRSSPLIRALLSGEKSARLFVRVRRKTKGKATPFTYCGILSTPLCEGDEPVTCLFEAAEYASNASGTLLEIYRWRPGHSTSIQTDGRRQSLLQRSAARSTGRQLDPRRRVAVEKCAMEAAIKHYRVLGFHVTDCSLNSSYDLICSDGKTIKRVEVKGSQGLAEVVELTIGEVNAARNDGVSTDLFILHSISVSESGGSVIAAGGTPRIFANWIPESERLTATRFSYSVSDAASP